MALNWPKPFTVKDLDSIVPPIFLFKISHQFVVKKNPLLSQPKKQNYVTNR